MCLGLFFMDKPIWESHHSMAKLFPFKVIYFVTTVLLIFNYYAIYHKPAPPMTHALKNSYSLWRRNLTLKTYPERNENTQVATISERAPDKMDISVNSSVKYVLLINTLGRSGTSWVGELMSQQVNSFYVFEPDFYIVNVLRKKLTKENGPHVIKSHFLCDFPRDFIEWARTQHSKPSNVFRSTFTRSCKNVSDCILPEELKNNCAMSPIRIIKMIRVKLQIVGILLKTGDLKDLKVVYLIRDPRAAMISRHRLGWITKPQSSCQLFEDDLIWYKKIQREFPKAIHLLRYESFCIDIKGEGTRLWQFLTGSSKEDMPFSWLLFLKRHSSLRKGSIRLPESVYGITRDTTTEWMNWRNEIQDVSYFEQIEKHCRVTIEAFGYNTFGSIDIARNLSYPALKSADVCPTIPC